MSARKFIPKQEIIFRNRIKSGLTLMWFSALRKSVNIQVSAQHPTKLIMSRGTKMSYESPLELIKRYWYCFGLQNSNTRESIWNNRPILGLKVNIRKMRYKTNKVNVHKEWSPEICKFFAIFAYFLQVLNPLLFTRNQIYTMEVNHNGAIIQKRTVRGR